MARRRSNAGIEASTVWLGASIILLGQVGLASQSLAQKSPQYSMQPPLDVVEAVLSTTAKDEFAGSDELYRAAANWDRARLLAAGRAGPHLACTRHDHGRKALAGLRGVFGRSAVLRVSNSPTRGTCFLVTTSAAEAATFSHDPERYGLESFGTLPSLLKLSHGLLDLKFKSELLEQEEGRLRISYGQAMRLVNVGGLEVQLSPGVSPVDMIVPGGQISDILDGLMSASINLHASNFWSDLIAREGNNSISLSHAPGRLRAREWTKAANVVHELSAPGGAGATPADVCSWEGLGVLNGGGRFLMITGIGVN